MNKTHNDTSSMEPQKNIYLSVIIPAYNEAKRIVRTLESVHEYLSRQDYEYEVIVVNDGSRDKTAYVAKDFNLRYGGAFKNYRVIDNKVNRGKGYAVKCGMLEAKGKYRLFMDADNSVTIDTVEEFIPQIDVAGSDVVIGSIKLGNALALERNGIHRRILSTLSKLPVRLFATPGIYDTQRGFKLFTAEAADTIFPKQTIERFGFDIELIVIALENGFKVKELPVVWDNPEGSKVSLSAYATTLRELAHIVYNKLRGMYAVNGYGKMA